jgi:hypothetical protein
MCWTIVNNNFLIVRELLCMPYGFSGPDSAQVGEIEKLAKIDPAAAAKKYKLRRYTFSGGKVWRVVSELPDMQGNDVTSVPGGLKGDEEKAFLDAIKIMK